MGACLWIAGVVLAGCGARSGLDPGGDPVAARPDAGSPRDAGERPDAGARPDAGPDLVCGVLPTIGFGIRPAGSVELEQPTRGLAIARGDGDALWVAVEQTRRAEIAVYRVDHGLAERVHAAPGVGPAIAWRDGTLAVAYASGERRDVSLDVTAGGVWAGSRVRVPRLDPYLGVDALFAQRLGWVVLARGERAFLARSDADGFLEPWTVEPLGAELRAATDPSTEHTWGTRLAGGTGLELLRFERGGPPAEVVPIEPLPWVGNPRLALSDDGFDQPLVLGGFQRDEAGELRIAARRIRANGTAGSGYSGPVPGEPGPQALTGAPPGGGHPSGYGLFVATETGGRRALFFHGSAGFVGDTRPVGDAVGADGFALAIAPHSCGYVLVWTDGLESPILHLAFAVPAD